MVNLQEALQLAEQNNMTLRNLNFEIQKASLNEQTTNSFGALGPFIENEDEWENSFMKSFYHLVTIHRHDFPADDYQHILVAFDDEHGVGINQRYITGPQLEHFMKTGEQIHYEEMFLTDVEPRRVVFWGYSNDRGWLERVEYVL